MSDPSAAGRPARGRDRWIDLQRFEHELENPSISPFRSWRPLVIALTPHQTGDFTKLCRMKGIPRIDTFDRQLLELAVIRLPAGDRAERQSLVDETLAAHEDSAAFGCWVYLPWERRAYHLLGPEDYFDVITDRNRDKITREEQRLLQDKRVGVVGLSVGGEAAFTVAQEHLCGTIVLADFDELELSNLNRLGTGFDALGVNTAVILARRIAKVDPYLDVRVFEDGVTQENLADFLGGLDLFLEECDGLEMKYHLRQEARRLGPTSSSLRTSAAFSASSPMPSTPISASSTAESTHPRPPAKNTILPWSS